MVLANEIHRYRIVPVPRDDDSQLMTVRTALKLTQLTTADRDEQRVLALPLLADCFCSIATSWFLMFVID